MANELKSETKAQVVSLLCEGNSIRSIERITGVHRDTVMRLGVRIGTACAKIQNEKMRGLNCAYVEVDEIWGFIGAKRKNAARAGAYGDVWTFIALDADTKLIPSFIVGKRDAYHAKAFIADLASRLQKRVQVSSDSLHAYADAMDRGFGSEVDYGQISKTFAFMVATSALSISVFIFQSCLLSPAGRPVGNGAGFHVAKLRGVRMISQERDGLVNLAGQSEAAANHVGDKARIGPQFLSQHLVVMNDLVGHLDHR